MLVLVDYKVDFERKQKINKNKITTTKHIAIKEIWS